MKDKKIGTIRWRYCPLDVIESENGYWVRAERISTELTWEEKHPIDYIFRPSEALKQLREKSKEIKREKERAEKIIKEMEGAPRHEIIAKLERADICKGIINEFITEEMKKKKRPDEEWLRWYFEWGCENDCEPQEDYKYYFPAGYYYEKISGHFLIRSRKEKKEILEPSTSEDGAKRRCLELLIEESCKTYFPNSDEISDIAKFVTDAFLKKFTERG
jgi:hypothetical protein